MLGRLKRWRKVILREAVLLRQFRAMDPAHCSVPPAPPIPATWADSLAELMAVAA